MRESSKYQPEIDGLRAVAILAVLLFHVGAKGFQGGFAGVDVFFTISGYLITGLIVSEIESTGSLRFGNFYLRRMRRLLPALFVTLVVTTVIAALMLTPEHMTRFGGSLAAAALSASNIFFWHESGYFDTESLTKPLLHTWSLAVEEQFYLIWPILLVLAMKVPRHAMKIVIVLGLLSFAAVAWNFERGLGFGDDSTTAFFWMPFRIWQFAAGAVLVWLQRHWRPGAKFTDLMLLAGLVLVVGTVMLADETSRFPYWAAIPACLGTVLILYPRSSIAEPAFPLTGIVLRNPVARWLGHVSYSVYLVHWPIIVFISYLELRPLSVVEAAIAVTLSLALGAALHYTIEVPFRSKSSPADGASVDVRPATAFGFIALAAVISVGAGLHANSNRGWQWRIAKGLPFESNSALLVQERKRYCKQANADIPANLFTCQFNRGKEKSIFIWGDSHGLHLVGGFAENFPGYNVYVAYLSGCVPQSGFGNYVHPYGNRQDTDACIKRNANVLKFFEQLKPSTIVLTSAKRGDAREQAAISGELVDKVKSAGHHVIYLGDFIKPGKRIYDCRSVPNFFFSETNLSNRCSPDIEKIQEELVYEQAQSDASRYLLDVRPVQCPSGKCQYFEGPLPLYRDDHHLSWRGSQYFVAKLKPQLNIAE
jgi:peptidoglycan/LPS O-acetylase OafA/YrhL